MCSVGGCGPKGRKARASGGEQGMTLCAGARVNERSHGIRRCLDRAHLAGDSLASRVALGEWPEFCFDPRAV